MDKLQSHSLIGHPTHKNDITVRLRDGEPAGDARPPPAVVAAAGAAGAAEAVAEAPPSSALKMEPVAGVRGQPRGKNRGQRLQRCRQLPCAAATVAAYLARPRRSCDGRVLDGGVVPVRAVRMRISQG